MTKGSEPEGMLPVRGVIPVAENSVRMRQDIRFVDRHSRARGNDEMSLTQSGKTFGNCYNQMRDRIAADPRIRHGKACIKGTRLHMRKTDTDSTNKFMNCPGPAGTPDRSPGQALGPTISW
jgi:hypothetical protein